MSFPKAVIIILNYNGFLDTTHCLKSVLKTDYPNFKIIVADNGSKIDESKILAKKFKDKRLQFVRFSKNLGFSGGNNKILKEIKDKYVILLNNDTEVTRKWLNPLIQTLERDSKIAAVQPKILWLTNKKYFDYAGAAGGFIDIFGYPFTRGRIFYTQEIDRGQYDKTRDIAWGSGAALVIRKKVLDKVGLFDKRFFNYMEEIDLCFRIQRAGFRILCVPKSTIFHRGATTAKRSLFKKRFWEHRNNILLVLKNYPFRKLLYLYPLRTLLEYASFFHYLHKKEYKFAVAVLLSQLSIVYFLPSIIIGKLSTTSNLSGRGNPLIVNRSIVVDYFFFKKRKFSEIDSKE